MFFDDTIAAIATASSGGGISVLRISGSDAIALTDPIVQFKNKSLCDCKSHTVNYGFVVDKERNVIDEVLVLVMKAPNSYTRENVVEIQCHGGAFVCQQILDLILEQGIRMAEPGEFTKRAFLNGRIDLSQAEAVMDLIEAKSKYALESSVSQLKGIIKDKISDMRKQILEDVAFIEAALDDPEHISLEEFENQFRKNLEAYISELEKIKRNYQNGRLIKEGIRTVIIGKPNVGKSSFLNAVLGVDRAIVTDIPGTTRDILEEDVRLGDILLHVVDTAGIHETEEPVEKIGIQRAKENLETSDFCIMIVDGSSELTKEDISLLNEISFRNSVVLINKNDLPVKVKLSQIEKITKKPLISFSAKTGVGLEELETYIKNQFYSDQLSFNDEIYITNERQKQAIIESYNSLLHVKESMDLNLGEDFYTIDLMNAYERLGSIIGESVEDDLVDTIFKKFCMGK